MNQQKRKRGKNFTATEETLLIELVEENKAVLENKKSDAVTWKQKADAWEKLSQQFSSQTGEIRPWKALRDKYENLKRQTKVELAAEKRETYRTGGGVRANSSVSAISEKISGMIGQSGTGLYNPFDNDENNNESMYNEETSEVVECYLEEENSNDVYDEVEYVEDAAPKWNLMVLKEKVSKKLQSTKTPRRKPTMEEEKIKLIQIQQKFYENENLRADEKHKYELQSIQYKNELLQLEFEEKKRRLTM
ncbi:myb/SANT-like DNA-binding domain-containing protein 3 [Haematobia irritans]|uniref:myb/SANT-like DNA-binding domain-containing protein 3 n=1 Tax=Haematobia irritans TaxID=7368 RepID=UPI003F4FECAE